MQRDTLKKAVDSLSGFAEVTSAWSSAGRARDSTAPSLCCPLPACVRQPSSLDCVWPFPPSAPPGRGLRCIGMTLPPEHLNYVSRGFGRGHAGLDLMAPFGSPIRAAGGGTVVYAGWYFAYGKVVDIRHAD